MLLAFGMPQFAKGPVRIGTKGALDLFQRTCTPSSPANIHLVLCKAHLPAVLISYFQQLPVVFLTALLANTNENGHGRFFANR